MQFKRANYQSPGTPGNRGLDDLEFYKLALDVVVNAHELARNLQSEEKFDMAVQIRRSSKSVTANIAEGYGRYHYLDSLRYYAIARGELLETQAHFTNALVLNYIPQAYFDQVYKLIKQTEIALNGFMTYIRRQQAGKAEFGNHMIRDDSAFYDTTDSTSPDSESPSD